MWKPSRLGEPAVADGVEPRSARGGALAPQYRLHRSRNSKVEIVDEFTGRVVENRRWPDGLQAAVEAKEGVPLQPQGIIRGSITLQHYLRLYPRVCGMTATAQPAAEEFQEFYDFRKSS